MHGRRIPAVVTQQLKDVGLESVQVIFDQGKVGKDKVVESLILFIEGDHDGQGILDRARVVPYRLFFFVFEGKS